MDYCSFRVKKGVFEYNILGRPLGGDHRILREVLVDETYRPLLKLLPPRPIRLVEIGSHIGVFTIWLHRQHGISEAFCFEPDVSSFTLCQFNLGREEPGKFLLHQQAIGGTTRQSEIWIDPTAHARSSLHRDRHTTLAHHAKIQVVALREWLEKTQGDFDLLKMDCEGSEWEILEHCPTGLQRFSIIIAEVHRHPDGRRDIRDFAAALSQYGFTTVDCDGLYVGRRN